MNALAVIVRADAAQAVEGKCAARCANGRAAGGKCAARGANGRKHARAAPACRASGPFVREALGLVSSVDAELSKPVSRGYSLETEANQVHAALKRLQFGRDTRVASLATGGSLATSTVRLVGLADFAPRWCWVVLITRGSHTLRA